MLIKKVLLSPLVNQGIASKRNVPMVFSDHLDSEILRLEQITPNQWGKDQLFNKWPEIIDHTFQISNANKGFNA